MAADGTSIKNDIDNDLANKGYRGIRIATIIVTLKKVVDWVTSVVNGNLSTWYKVGTSNAPATNADDVYRTGKMVVGRTNLDGTGSALQTDSFSLASIPWTGGQFINTQSTDWDTLLSVGTYCVGGDNTWLSTGHGPGVALTAFAYGTLHVYRGAGGSIVQAYFDNSGYVYYRQKWQTLPWGDWYCPQRPANLTISNKLGFGTTTPDALLDLGSASGIKQLVYGNGGDTGYRMGFGLNLGQAPNTFAAFIGPPLGNGVAGDGSFSVVSATTTWPYTAFTTRFSVLSSGSVGVGVANPAERFHVAGGNALVEGNITAGTTAVPKDVTAYGKFKSYFGSVLRAFAFGGATTTSGLTLKTTQYVSLEIDGTVYKLALVN